MRSSRISKQTLTPLAVRGLVVRLGSPMHFALAALALSVAPAMAQPADFMAPIGGIVYRNEVV
jgi:hypothetical protein